MSVNVNNNDIIIIIIIIILDASMKRFLEMNFPSFEDIASRCYASLYSLLRIAFTPYKYELLFVRFTSI